MAWVEGYYDYETDYYSYDLFLSYQGNVTRLTDNGSLAYDFLMPFWLNADGRVVWAASDGSDTEIYGYNPLAAEPQVYQITDNEYFDMAPQINNQGQVAWLQMTDPESPASLYLAGDGGVATPDLISGNVIPANPLTAFSLNNLGHLAWLGLDEDGTTAQIYTYDGAATLPVAASAYIFAGDFAVFQINDLDQVFWLQDGAIYRSQLGSDAAATINPSPGDIWFFQANNAGQVAWVQTTDNGDNLYLYDPAGGAALIGSSSGYIDLFDLNNAGQVVWEDYNGGHLYTPGPDGYRLEIPDAYMVQINNQGQVAYVNDYSSGVFLGEVLTGIGDYYTGYGYASGQDLQTGLQDWTGFDENGQKGYYVINSISPDSYVDPSQFDTVYVGSYFDYESGGLVGNNQLFSGVPEPVNPYNPEFGAAGLGSEFGYIVQADYEEFRFGAVPDNSFNEADIPPFHQTWLGANLYGTPVYNDAGQAAWIGNACYGEAVFLYSNGQVSQISEIFSAISGLQINSAGEMVWDGGAYNESSNIEYQVFLYSNGGYTAISPAREDAYSPQIDNLGRVYFVTRNGSDEEVDVYDGNLTPLSGTYEDVGQLTVNENGQAIWGGYTTADGWNLYAATAGGPVDIDGGYTFVGPLYLSDNGKVFWLDNSIASLYMYDLNTGGAPVLIYNDPTGIAGLEINDTGQAVWENFNTGEIYLYDGGAPLLITTTTMGGYSYANPQINDLGQVVWETFDGGQGHVFLTTVADIHAQNPPEEISTVVSDAYWPQLNNDGQVIWQTANQIYFYQDGVSYPITFAGNYPGQIQLLPAGQVLWEDDFGRLTMSSPGATPAAEQTFIYYYGGSDYYTGRVYTAVNQEYALGYREYVGDENGGIGYYEITNNTFAGDPFLAGQVVVDSYYDSLSGLTFDQADNLHSFVSSGSSYLGSEYGYITAVDNWETQFGNLGYEGYIYEADAGADAGIYEYYFGCGYAAENTDPIYLTNNAVNEFLPVMNDSGQAVWSGWDGENYEIYLYDGDRIRQLTHEGAGKDQLYPWINNSGQVVWSAWDDGNLDIRLFDLNTGVEQHQPSTPYNEYFPMINDNGQITWVGESQWWEGQPPETRSNAGRFLPDGASEVYAYDLTDPMAVPILVAANHNTFNGVVNRPVINNEADIVYAAWNGSTSDIYLYSMPDNAYTQVTDNGVSNNPYINDVGQLVYNASDGLDNEIYLANLYNDSSFTIQITTNGVTDSSPAINNLGQVVWQQGDEGNREIWLYTSDGNTYRVTNNAVNDIRPLINDKGQIVYNHAAPNGNYDVALVNSTGDMYYGTVLAAEDYGYYPGYTFTGINEYGGPVVYQIVGIGGLQWDVTQAGQVNVEEYYDSESGVFFTTNLFPDAGQNYLGSEAGYILATDGYATGTEFGGGTFYDLEGGQRVLYGAQEADVPAIQYDFTYYYGAVPTSITGGGDYYSGQVWAEPGRYYPGYRETVVDENGQTGYYLVGNQVDYSTNTELNGQVSVSKYYDTDTAKTFWWPDNAEGDNYLGSESGFIIQEGNPQFYFGHGFFEAAVSTADTYIYKQITANSINDDFPRMNGMGQMVYTQGDGADAEIYLWNGSGLTNISNNTTEDANPVIWGDRQVAWSGFDGQDWEIFYYDPSHGVVQVTNNAYDDGYTPYTDLITGQTYYQGPLFGGSTAIVWAGGDANNKEIFSYNISTGITTQITTDSYNDDFLRVNTSGQIAWLKYEPGDREVYLYTPGESPPGGVNISNNDFDDRAPRMNDGGQVVWSGGDPGARQIYLFDDGFTENISNGAYALDNIMAGINNAGQVAWSGFDGNNWQIYAYTDGFTHQVTYGYRDNTSPSILPRGEIIWRGQDEQGLWQVYELLGSNIQQVSHSDFDVMNYGLIGDGRIAWAEFDGQDYDIRMALPAPEFYISSNITNNNVNDFEPSDNAGQVVYSGWDPVTSHFQIYLADAGVTTQLTSYAWDNVTPTMNNRGEITWAGQEGGNWQVFLYRDGQITQLTDDSFDNAHSLYSLFGQDRYHPPMINAQGQIVWSGGLEGNKEIYFYDGSTVHQITDNGVNDDYAFINSAGQIAWTELVDGNWQVFYSDAANNGTPVQMTRGPYDHVPARIGDQGQLVWSENSGGDWDVYYSPDHDPLNVINLSDLSNQGEGNPYDDNRVRIMANGWVVWQAFDGHDWEINKWDGYGVHQLTDNAFNDLEPRGNSQGQIVWSGFNGHDFDTYLYDSGSVTQISANSGNDILPRINNLGQVVWEGQAANGTWDIYLAYPTTATRTLTRITDRPGDDKNVFINASGQMVWEGWDTAGNDWDIFYYDGSTVTMLTDAGDQRDPVINNNGDIAWMDYADGTRIFFKPSGGAASSALTLTSYDAELEGLSNSGQILYLTWDQDGDHLNLFDYSTSTTTPVASGRMDAGAINNTGLVAYAAFDGQDNEIYLYNIGSGQTYLVTNNSGDDGNPSLNDHGQLVWNHNDGSGYSAWMYSNGVITPVSDPYSDYDAGMPVINNMGQISYIAYDGGDLEIYFQLEGVTRRLTGNTFMDENPSINTARQVAFTEQYAAPTGGSPGNSNLEIMVSSPTEITAARYNFTFHYSDGDSYAGQFYAPLNDLYAVGSKQYMADESGSQGYYEITAREYLTDSSSNGQVLVNSYFDQETGNTYAPLNAGAPLGSDYLGSESGHIVQTGIDSLFFGNLNGVNQEADSYGLFTFRYDYGSGGDYYTGTVYASYGDPPNPFTPGYHVDQTWDQDDETGTGFYTITGFTGMDYDYSLWGVTADFYHDGESGQDYVPVTSSYGDFLGTESGYIGYDNTQESQFGLSEGIFYEADYTPPPPQGYAHPFTFFYDTGDSYSGIVYSGLSYYTPPYTQGSPVTTETGTGYYYVGDCYLGPPGLVSGVYIDSYYDSQTLSYYTPTSYGGDYLGSESGYIGYESTQDQLFGLSGGIFYEADYTAPPQGYTYNFTFYYDSGDYYSGTVYAGLGYTPPSGVVTESGQGHYELSGPYYAPPGQDGLVYVDSYTDGESGRTYTGNKLFFYSAVAGADYLGSESGYIIQADNSEFFFGAGQYDTGDGFETRIFEADLGIEYTFTHYYDLGTPSSYVTDAVTQDNFQAYNLLPRMNNAGQVVFYGGADSNSLEIYLYQDGAVTPITNNQAPDLFPDINNRGDIVYVSLDPDSTAADLYLYAGGQTTLIQHADTAMASPMINDSGQIVWLGGPGLNELYLFNDGQTTPVTADGKPCLVYQTDQMNNVPVINDSGQIVWAGTVEGQTTTEIFLYDVASGAITQITTNAVDDNNPYINNSGQIVWTGGVEGQAAPEIFLYDLNTITTTQITADSLIQGAPAINDAGQIVYQQMETGGAYEIYLYRDGAALRITENAYQDMLPQINNNGEIVWSRTDAEDHGEIMRTFNSAQDYYVGRVYVTEATNPDYAMGYLQPTLDQEGDGGQYLITAKNYVEYTGLTGQVFVDTYYDAESRQDFSSPGGNLFVTPGDNYLGSESGHIRTDQFAEFFFGNSGDGLIFEAEGRYTTAYSFTYHFGDGDLYTDRGDSFTGTVYAAPDFGYGVGDRSGDVLDERFLLGYYSIDAADATIYPYVKKGQVFISSYVDADSGNTYGDDADGPLVTGPSGLAGVNYLGSEGAYIAAPDVAEYYFGAGADGKMMEADFALAGAYQFSFTFADGDFYTGTAYAELLHGYSVGQAWTTQDEHGQTGTYQITGVSYGNDTSKEGQVQITSYFDAETGKTFTPTGGGALYLGSEYGSIGAGPKAGFGGGYEEAEVSGKVYTFKFTYADGDYYTGTVYADPTTSPYFMSYSREVADAHGAQVGTYEITGVADGTAKDSKQIGKVFVSGYHDAQSGRDYTPVGANKALGSKGLGSESGYIVKKGTPYLQFGAVNGDFKEADLAAQYSFTYYYGSDSGSGDSYTGTLYAALGSYTVGQTMYKMDENGYQGYYKIDAVNPLGYSAKPLGQVYVSSYYDEESGQAYKPLSKKKAAGTGGLGSEHDYILNKNVPAHQFGNYGGGFYEADIN